MIPDFILRLTSRQAVDAEALRPVLHEILEGDIDPVLIGDLLVALRSVELDPATLTLFAEVCRHYVRPVHCTVRPLIDTCGTGGDGAGSFNISTAAAFVTAAAGGAVAKHGNRSVSSQTGSADVLEALGLPLELPPQHCARMIDSTGFAFLFAPNFHPVMAKLAPVRRALGVPTIFNLVGPLINPTQPEFQVVGVGEAKFLAPMAAALRNLGTRASLVVHCAGLDELGLHAPTQGFEIRGDTITPFEFDGVEHGLPRTPIQALAGGNAKHNATLMLRVLGGEPGPLADVVALNAAAACYVAGLVDSMPAGIERTRDLLRSGAARRVLDRSLESSKRLTSPTPA